MLYLFLKDHKSELSTEIDTLIPIMVKGYFITACDIWQSVSVLYKLIDSLQTWQVKQSFSYKAALFYLR